MDHIGLEMVLVWEIMGAKIEFDARMLVMSWISMLIVIFGALVLRRGMRFDRDFEEVPSKSQAFLEIVLKGLYDQLAGGFQSKKLGEQLFPLLATLGVYILFLNWLALIPGMASPTETVNIPISLGLFIFVLSHYYRIKLNGPVGYLKSYMEAPGIMGVIMIPLSIVGEIARPISHSFRLYGNLMGGAILLIVIANLVPLWVVPLHTFLNFFYILFVGAIQAMVFTLLSVAYIGMAEGEH